VTRGVRRRALLLVALVTILSACTLDLDVRVDVHADGGGTVDVIATVDAAALARVGGDLGAVLRLDDLRAEGWSVTGPDATGDGGQTVRLRQSFADPAGARRVFEQLAGRDGPLHGFAVTHDTSLVHRRWSFRGTVDLGGDTPIPTVAPGPDGKDAAATIDQLQQQLGESLGRLLRLRVGVRLPGHVTSNATTKAENGAVWQVAFNGAPVHLEATGEKTRGEVVAGAVAVGLLVLVGGVVLLVRLAGRVSTPEREAARR